MSFPLLLYCITVFKGESISYLYRKLQFNKKNNKRFRILFTIYSRLCSNVVKCHFGQPINARAEVLSVWCPALYSTPLDWTNQKSLSRVSELWKPNYSQGTIIVCLRWRVRLLESSASAHLRQGKKRKMVTLRWKMISGMIHRAVLFYLCLVRLKRMHKYFVFFFNS